MGTNCAPLLADLYLYTYESAFIQNLLKQGQKKLARSFNFTYRYIDDVLSINNEHFAGHISSMYPPELEIKDTTESNVSTSYLDLQLTIDDTTLHTKIYDKRDDFNFKIVNFPFLDGNIPASPAYGVFISQLVRYARGSSKYIDFCNRATLLTSRLLQQGYSHVKLCKSCKKFYGRHHTLVVKYDVSVSQLICDILPTS